MAFIKKNIMKANQASMYIHVIFIRVYLVTHLYVNEFQSEPLLIDHVSL